MTYTVTSATTITLREYPCPSQTFQNLRFLPPRLFLGLHTQLLCEWPRESLMGLVTLEEHHPGFLLHKADHPL